MEDRLHKPIACGAVLGAVFGVVMWMLVFNSGSLLFAMPINPEAPNQRAVQAEKPVSVRTAPAAPNPG